MDTNERIEEPVDPDESLITLGARPTAGAYAREIWDRREFTVRVPVQDMRVENIDTVLGQFWQLLNPALTVAVYFLVFGVILSADRGVDNYLGFLVVGVLLYNLLSRVVTVALRAIDANQGLIRSVQFPRAVLPLSTVVLQLLAFLPSTLVLFVALVLTGETPQLRWLWFGPIFALFALVLVGSALTAARAGAGLRDLSLVQPHVFRVLFYLSGILFAVDQFVEDERLLRLFAVNPLFDAVELSRWAFLDRPFEPLHLLGLLAWAIIFPVVGLVYFARAEHTYGA